MSFGSNIEDWIRDRGDYTHRLQYDLNENSVVLDVGGYEGQFADLIYQKYKCNIYIFEPLNYYYNTICGKFENLEKIRIFNSRLCNLDGISFMSDEGDKSSFFSSNNKISVKSITLNQFLKESKLEMIDLVKINIEGDEYDLIDDFLEKEQQTKLKNIQVQFHTFVPNFEERYEKIKHRLLQSHKLTYRYDYIWENWELKK